MRIEVEIPDWAEGRTLHIMAGMEEIARKPLGRPWKVKTGRCVQCGKCCMDVPRTWPMGRSATTRNCQWLIYYANEWRCDFLGSRPFACSISDASGQPHCSIEWSEQ